MGVKKLKKLYAYAMLQNYVKGVQFVLPGIVKLNYWKNWHIKVHLSFLMWFNNFASKSRFDDENSKNKLMFS